ncbi:DUF4302 domain-containing protein [Porphyromonas macacae]|uniref:DUF4302 domain-containing protein n=1 Tax=Porphyromonas macacae TaxID=28115 RepID=A0A379DGQ7_9PORP|nr:DUF4302 domain-containing protein [Porphyromonas macacae]SUB77526.1 Uncharacterised protein [Porphyromonas macacae]
MIRNFLLSLPLYALLAVGCKQDNAFDRSPAERMERHIENFKQTLVSAPHGWQLQYFPRVDSLLFRNPSTRLDWTDVTKDKYGYGGYLMLIKFAEGNRLEIKADLTDRQAKNVTSAEYDIRLGSSLQLSFTTHAPLHELVNSEFGGVSDFVYRYRDYWGNLIFTTGVSDDSNRPYIVLSPLKTAEEWKSGAEQAFENRKFFESMVHPQIRIRRGSRIFFQSDVPFKKPGDEQNKEKELERNRRRYHIFLSYREKYDPIFRGYNGLGSGYTGTKEGLSFRPGFSYDDKTTFFDFERKGDKFVAELVSVYDPLFQKFHFESKHLFPEGEPTSYIAEIIDTHKQ